MFSTLVDTDILSRFFRNDHRVIGQMEAYVQEYGAVLISILTYFEVLSRLLHRDAKQQLNAFLAFVFSHRTLPLTHNTSYFGRLPGVIVQDCYL